MNISTHTFYSVKEHTQTKSGGNFLWVAFQVEKNWLLSGIIRWFSIFGPQFPPMVLSKTSKFYCKQNFQSWDIDIWNLEKSVFAQSSRFFLLFFSKISKFKNWISQLWNLGLQYNLEVLPRTIERIFGLIIKNHLITPLTRFSNLQRQVIRLQNSLSEFLPKHVL